MRIMRRLFPMKIYMRKRIRFAWFESKEINMYCSHCGKELDDDSIYCPACGKRVSGGGTGSFLPGALWERAREKVDGSFWMIAVAMLFLCFAMYRGTFIPKRYQYERYDDVYSARTFDSLMKITSVSSGDEINLFLMRIWKEIRAAEREFREDYDIYEIYEIKQVRSAFTTIKICTAIPMLSFLLAAITACILIYELFSPVARRGNVAFWMRGFTYFALIGLGSILILNLQMKQVMATLNKVDYGTTGLKYGVTGMYVISVIVALFNLFYLIKRYDFS